LKFPEPENKGHNEDTSGEVISVMPPLQASLIAEICESIKSEDIRRKIFSILDDEQGERLSQVLYESLHPETPPSDPNEKDVDDCLVNRLDGAWTSGFLVAYFAVRHNLVSAAESLGLGVAVEEHPSKGKEG